MKEGGLNMTSGALQVKMHRNSHAIHSKTHCVLSSEHFPTQEQVVDIFIKPFTLPSFL